MYFLNVKVLLSENMLDAHAWLNAVANKHQYLQEQGCIQPLTCMTGYTQHIQLPGCRKGLGKYARDIKCLLKPHVREP